MANCPQCNREMRIAPTCYPTPYRDGNVDFPPVPYGSESPMVDEHGAAQPLPRSARCRDCGVELGGVHHPRCCLEECPRCHGQALVCDCFTEPVLADSARTGDR